MKILLQSMTITTSFLLMLPLTFTNESDWKDATTIHRDTDTYLSTGIIRHDTDIEKYREMGGRSEFDCLGRYSISEASQDFAAGVLVSPTWVLTAAHFVEDSSVWMFGGAFYQTKRIIKHPKLLPGAEEAQWDGWDMALVELRSPVANVKPAGRYRGRDELGSVITKIGYGYVGDGLSGLKSPRRQERLGGQNTIDAIGGTVDGRNFGTDVMVCDFDSPTTNGPNRFGSAMPLELEIGGSKGDSGGGVFVKKSGQWQLVGIVSGGLNRELKYGSMMAFARVSSANAWIDSVVSQ